METRAPSQETLNAGIRYNGIATGVGIILALCMLPPVGAAVGFYYTRKAQTVGNPAITGRIVLFINIVITVAIAVVVWQGWEAAQQFNQQMPAL